MPHLPEAPSVTGVDGADERSGDAGALGEVRGRRAAERSDRRAGQYRFARMPLLGDAESYTMAGKRGGAASICPTTCTIDRIGALLLFHYPTTWNHILADHAITFRVTAAQRRPRPVTTKWLVHKDAVEGVDYDLKELTQVWTETNDQDRQIVEENALRHPLAGLPARTLFGIHEGGVIQFVDWYAALHGARLAEGDKPPLRSVA